MSFDWNALLANSGGQAAAVIEAGVIAHFGNLDSELDAASRGTVVAPLGHLGLIVCAGADARTFLHNQLTSDISHLPPGKAQHSAWCNPKGRMLASFLVDAGADGLTLQLADELTAPVLKRLQMFVLRAAVRLADVSAEQALIGLAGPAAGDALAAAGLPAPADLLGVANHAAGVVIRLDEHRYQVRVAGDRAAIIWQALAQVATPVGVSAWRWLDIEAGLPVITAATREEFVPQMTNFEQLGGVSFHKGCYPGQEVVARTQYLGKVKRHLYRVRAGEAMLPGTPMYAAGAPEQVCGQIVTAAPAPGGGWLALAVLQESVVAGEIHLRSPDGPRLAGAAPVATTVPAAD